VTVVEGIVLVGRLMPALAIVAITLISARNFKRFSNAMHDLLAARDAIIENQERAIADMVAYEGRQNRLRNEGRGAALATPEWCLAVGNTPEAGSDFAPGVPGAVWINPEAGIAFRKHERTLSNGAPHVEWVVTDADPAPAFRVVMREGVTTISTVAVTVGNTLLVVKSVDAENLRGLIEIVSNDSLPDQAIHDAWNQLPHRAKELLNEIGNDMGVITPIAKTNLDPLDPPVRRVDLSETSAAKEPFLSAVGSRLSKK
jgi:hypothetical protein